MTAHAGVIPAVDPSDPRALEVQRFSASLGALGWWTALGRDAATLARLAMRARLFPILPARRVTGWPA